MWNQQVVPTMRSSGAAQHSVQREVIAHTKSLHSGQGFTASRERPSFTFSFNGNDGVSNSVFGFH
jgi:hypothetical protein